MSTRRRRAAIALVVIAAAAHAVAPGPVAADDEPRRDPLSIAEERFEAARQRAIELIESLSVLQAEEARLEADIAESEQMIPQIRARADLLRLVVKQRAIRLYVGRDLRLDAVLQTESVIDGARGAILTGTMARHDFDFAAELNSTARELEAREQLLRNRRAQLQQTIGMLAALQEPLLKHLEGASFLYEKVKGLLDEQGESGIANVATGSSRCPVDGFTLFTDDFGAPRPDDRLHQGIDLVALPETPLVAVVDGIIRHDIGELGGNGVWLSGIDEVGYYYAHLSRYEGEERIVAAGDVIGYVGSTGHSTGPHLHFEVHPKGGLAVNGYTLLLVLCGNEMARPFG